MNRKLIPIIGAVALLLTASCSTLYRAVITVTEVRDSAMKELAQLSKQQLLTPEQDQRITEIDAAYLRAALVTERSLVAYQNGGNRAEFVATLTALKEIVGQYFEILNTLNTQKTQELETKLALASKP